MKSTESDRKGRALVWGWLALGPLLAYAAVLMVSPLAACGGGSDVSQDAGADVSAAEGGDSLAMLSDDVFVPQDAPNDTMSILSDGGAPSDAPANTCQVLECPGVCKGGACVEVLTSVGAYAFALEGATLYFTAPGTLAGLGTVESIPTQPTATTSTPVTLAKGQTFPRAIAALGTEVYWANDSPTAGTVMTVPESGQRDGGSEAGDAGDGGGGPTGAVIAGGQVSPVGIAVDADNVYWTSTGSLTAANGTVVKAARKSGIVLTLASGRFSPSMLAVDSNNVYWIDLGTGVDQGAVLKVPIVGGNVTTLAAGQNSPSAIAVDQTSVYWTQLGTSTNTSAVVKTTLDGGTVATIAGRQGPLAGITVDAKNIYWAVVGGNGTGAIYSAAVDGNVITTVQMGLDSPLFLATDATSLYWTDAVDGTLTKLTPK